MQTTQVLKKFTRWIDRKARTSVVLSVLVALNVRVIGRSRWWMVPLGAAGFMAAVVGNEIARSSGQPVEVLTSLGAIGSLVYTGAAIGWAFWYLRGRDGDGGRRDGVVIPPPVALAAALGVGTQVVDAGLGATTLDGADLALDLTFALVASLLMLAFIIQAVPTRLQGEGSGLVKPLWLNATVDLVWSLVSAVSGRWLEGAILLLIAVAVAMVGYGIAASCFDEELMPAAG